MVHAQAWGHRQVCVYQMGKYGPLEEVQQGKVSMLNVKGVQPYTGMSRQQSKGQYGKVCNQWRGNHRRQVHGHVCVGGV